jgi:hypothetical protein
VGLALTGLAWGQTSPTVPGGDPQGRIITVSELGKPGQKCKVLKSWRQKDGSRAYLVQAVETGERMTIVEADNLAAANTQGGARVKAFATRIFHWGQGTTPPGGSPIPPPDPVVAAPRSVSPATGPRAGMQPAMGATSSGQRAWPTAFAGQKSTPQHGMGESYPSDVVVVHDHATPAPAPVLAQAPAAAPKSSVVVPEPSQEIVPAHPTVAALKPTPVFTPSDPGVPAEAPSISPSRPAGTAPLAQKTPETAPALRSNPAPKPGPVVQRSPQGLASSSTLAPTAPPGGGLRPMPMTPRLALQGQPLRPLADAPSAFPGVARKSEVVSAASAPAETSAPGIRKLDNQPLPSLTPKGPEPKPMPLPNALAQKSLDTKPAPQPSTIAQKGPETKPAPLPKVLVPKTPETTPTAKAAEYKPPQILTPKTSTSSSGKTTGPVIVSGNAPAVPATELKSTYSLSGAKPQPLLVSKVFNPYSPAPEKVTHLVSSTTPAKVMQVTPSTTTNQPAAKVVQAAATTPANPDKPADKPATAVVKPPVIITKAEAPRKVSTEAPAVSDWRQSWGRTDTPRSVEVVKSPTKPSVPHADTSKPDPLKQPEVYTKVGTEPALAAKPAVSSTAVAAAPPPPSAPAPRLQPEPTSPPPTLGMGSVIAASSPQLQQPSVNSFGSARVVPNPPGIPVVSLPAGEANAFSEPQAPPPLPVVANAFHGTGQPMPASGPLPPSAVAMAQPPMPPVPPMMPVLVDAGTPSGMANAFTEGSTARPIPSDFGPSQSVTNAFDDPSAPMMGAVAMRPPMPLPVAPRRPMPQPAGVASASHGSLPGPAGTSVPQLLSLLRDSLYPSQREWAAQHLSAHDWHAQPEVVDGLLAAAREDPAPAVRAECVRALVRMKVETVPVVSAMQALKADTDPHVRQEAEQALTALMTPTVPRVDSSVRPASATK